MGGKREQRDKDRGVSPLLASVPPGRIEPVGQLLGLSPAQASTSDLATVISLQCLISLCTDPQPGYLEAHPASTGIMSRQ